MYFTKGCMDLVIETDHKPLVKIFGIRTLDEIQYSSVWTQANDVALGFEIN